MTPLVPFHPRHQSARALGLLVSILALTMALLVGCGSESTIDPGADPNAVVWTKLTNLPTETSALLRDVQALYPDWRGDSVVFCALGNDPASGKHLRLAFVNVNDGAGATVTGYPGLSNWNDITPKWVSPGHVVFSSSRDPAGAFDIWYRNVDTGADHRLMNTAAYETRAIPKPGSPGLAYAYNTTSDSRNGRLVYMPDTANVAGQSFQTAPGLKIGEPAWDPTGTKIVFSADSTAGTVHYRHIWWTAVGDTASHQLTFGPYEDDYPSFRPDGSSILFESDRSGRSSLWLVDPVLGEAAGVTRIAWQDPGPQIYFPIWSPDGQRIMVTVDGDNTGRQLWILSNLKLP